MPLFCQFKHTLQIIIYLLICNWSILAVQAGKEAGTPANFGHPWQVSKTDRRLSTLFVSKTSGTCVGSGYKVVGSRTDCATGAVQVGWDWGGKKWCSMSPTMCVMEHQCPPGGCDKPPGCFLWRITSSVTTANLNNRWNSNVPCSGSMKCLCFTGPACTHTDGMHINPSPCMCGRTICNSDANGNGVYCLADTYGNGQCVVPCQVRDGSSVNSGACHCGGAPGPPGLR